MHSLRTLPEILIDLQLAAPAGSFENRLSALSSISGQATTEELRELAIRIRARVGREAGSTAARYLFRDAVDFPKSHRKFPRLDEVAKELFLPPSEEPTVVAALRRLPDLSMILHYLAQMTAPSVGDLFRCPYGLPFHLQRHRPGDPLWIAPDQPDTLTDEETMRLGLDILITAASNLVAEWWSARADCVAVAVAELVCALQEGAVTAFALSPDGSEPPLLPKFWRSSDGFECLFQGCVEMKETGNPTRGGIYINSANAVARIRGPISDKRFDKATAWLREQADRSPNEQPMGPDGVRMTKARWFDRAVEVGFNWLTLEEFDNEVWDAVVKPDHTWARRGRPKKIAARKTKRK